MGTLFRNGSPTVQAKSTRASCSARMLLLRIEQKASAEERGGRRVLATLIHYRQIGLIQFSNNFFAITSGKWCLLPREDALEAFVEIANLIIVSI